MITLGVDFGGSGIKGCPVDVTIGEMVNERFRLPTPEKARPKDVAEVIGEIAQHFEWKGPIGIGFPAVIRNGIAYSAANIHKSWIGTNAVDLFHQATNCPTYVLNDADAAGIAEMRFGVGKERSAGVVIVLTLGTGIGSAIFVDGILVPNTEFGHLVIRGKDAEARAGDAARQRDGLTWEEYAVRLTEYLNEMEKLFSPELFIISGGVSKSWEKYFPLLKIHTPILPARFLNRAGIIGAAMYAAEKDSARK
ncbi:MAG TPA: ROK family protein [Anaerolineaceae bacterium]